MTNENELTDDEVGHAIRIFEGKVEDKSACWHCGGIHSIVAKLRLDQQPCPRIKRVERNPDGFPLITEYWPPGTWEKDVLFLHQIYDDDVEDETN